MMELVEAFDKLDENLDTQVTLEEFLKYQVYDQSFRTETKFCKLSMQKQRMLTKF